MECGLVKRRLIVLWVCCIVAVGGLCGSECLGAARSEVRIPDIPGYLTLKCDFHMHTVFSDGRVWPTVRVEEAWREGLDAIAITDHVEYKPHRKDVRPSCNRPYEIALPAAKGVGLILIRGAEITRDMPPGHINATFLKDADVLDTNDWRDALKIALEQGAFIFWNHPGWTGQQPDGKSRWYPEHTWLYEEGLMHGIEVVNGDSYYPLAHGWALEKKLTIIGNSDVHNPTGLDYDFAKGEHRTMTLVFAKERNEEAIKEALAARRTAVYYRDRVIGEEEYLRAIFDESVKVLNPEVVIKGKDKTNIRVHNESELDFELIAEGALEEVVVPARLTLYGDKTVLLPVQGKLETVSGRKEMRIPYRVEGLLSGPGQSVRVELPVSVSFVDVKSKGQETR